MSGIAGLMRRDGEGIDSSRVHAMTARIAHRGPDGLAVETDGPGGLGQATMVTTPEGRVDSLPRVEGDLMVALDGRIDNRRTLVDRYDLDETPVADSELVLESYRRHGLDCPDHLVGAFAFALWDGERGRLVCARDHIGIRPLSLVRAGDGVAVASEMKALFALDEHPPASDGLRVGEYLVDLDLEHGRSFFDRVEKLPPGHRLVTTPREVRIERYWDPDPNRTVDLPTDRAYARRFRELFRQAVECRLRSTGGVTAALSGGLDSSSVCCVARDSLADRRELPLQTLSVVFDDVPESDEREYVETVLATGGFAPTRVPGDRTGPLTDLSGRLYHREEPFYPEVFAWEAEYREALADRDGRVVLEGFGGDQVVSYGWGVLRELAWKGRWIRLARELDGFAEKWGQTRRDLLVSNVVAPLAPGPVRRLKHAVSGGSLVSSANETVDPAFADRVGLADHLRRVRIRTPPRTHRRIHRQELLSPDLAHALEGMNKVAVAAGVQPRYPFLDRRLVEFCLALPNRQKVRGPRSRYVLREAMDGIVPDEIRNRRSKAEFSSAFLHGLSSFDTGRLRDSVLAPEPAPVDGYVDAQRLRDVFDRFEADPTLADARLLGRAAVLATWETLRRDGFEPPSDGDS